ncbi:MAG: hemerythrin domain-containing protein [Stackebrandtia sp.]
MDAATAITRDHDEIRHLVDRIVAMEEDVEFLIAQLRLRVAAHTATTETQVYPPLAHEDPGCAVLTDKHATQHRSIGSDLDAVERALGTEDFAASVTEFGDRVARELDSEETTVLPLLRKLLSAERQRELGHRFELRWLAEMDVQTPRPKPPQEPTA